MRVLLIYKNVFLIFKQVLNFKLTVDYYAINCENSWMYILKLDDFMYQTGIIKIYIRQSKYE